MPQDYSALTPEQIAQLQALAELPDELIDTSDTPEIPADAKGEVGKFYRPVKIKVTLELDAFVLDWFMLSVKGGKGYQKVINQALMDHIRRQQIADRVRD